MLRLTYSEESKYYKVRLETNLLFLNKTILSTETEYIWKYRTIEQLSYNTWIVSLKVLSQNQTNITATHNATDFLNLTNKPFEELILQLDGNGAIVKIHNKNEVIEKWNIVKNEYISKNIKFWQEEQKIFDKCDDDFRDLLTVLKSSLLHFIFFSPVYYVHPDNTIKRNLTFPSVVNSGTPLYNTIRQKIISNNDIWEVNQHCQHTDYGSTNLKKKYNNELTKFLNAPFDYQFHYDAKSIYDSQNGLLKTSNVSITEQASEDYIYRAKVSISLTTKDQ